MVTDSIVSAVRKGFAEGLSGAVITHGNFAGAHRKRVYALVGAAAAIAAAVGPLLGGAITLIGTLLVWSATRHVDGAGYLVRHLINTAIGVTLAVLVIRTDSRIIRALAPWVYLGAVLGLVLVLSPLGSTINGSRSWIQVPGFSIQPAELAKVALCVGLAMILAERGERGAPPPPRAWPRSAGSRLSSACS